MNLQEDKGGDCLWKSFDIIVLNVNRYKFIVTRMLLPALPHPVNLMFSPLTVN